MNSMTLAKPHFLLGLRFLICGMRGLGCEMEPRVLPAQICLEYLLWPYRSILHRGARGRPPGGRAGTWARIPSPGEETWALVGAALGHPDPLRAPPPA